MVHAGLNEWFFDKTTMPILNSPPKPITFVNRHYIHLLCRRSMPLRYPHASHSLFFGIHSASKQHYHVSPSSSSRERAPYWKESQIFSNIVKKHQHQHEDGHHNHTSYFFCFTNHDSTSSITAWCSTSSIIAESSRGIK